MNLIVKIILTVVIVLAAAYPYLDSSMNTDSTLNTIFYSNLTVGILVMVVFFISVGFYCKTLQTCLELIHPECQAARPKSVWLMFLIPYNIIEDFFIIINVSKSIEAEAKRNASLSMVKEFGIVSGIGWCIAQILSFIPNIIGQIAGLVGLVLWVAHWRFIANINRLLATEVNRERRESM
jgi:hypothetical protein